MSEKAILVGDAGGTSTSWRVIQGESFQQFETEGFNPYTHDLKQFSEQVRNMISDEELRISKIYLYMAGADTETSIANMQEVLRSILEVPVLIENDLFGVARAVLGAEKGYACILGTGANACYYDGVKVDKVSASLGYILGDEGSGAYLAKQLIQKVYRAQIDPEIVQSFQQTYKLSIDQLIANLYNHPHPNQYLGSFASFLSKHRNHPEIYQLIRKGFLDFFDAFFLGSDQSLPMSFAGSVAFYFSDMLKDVAQEKNFTVGRIVQSPIAGLALYHQQYG